MKLWEIVQAIRIFFATYGFNIVTVIFYAIKEIFFSSEGWKLIGQYGLKGITIGGSIGLVLGLLGGIFCHETKKSANKKNEIILRENEEVVNKWNDLQKQIDIIRSEEKEANKVYEDILRTKEKLYARNIIYPTYRNLVSVSMFYDYLQSGRCTTLEGHEGAYNLYEYESRMNIIFMKLDDIIEGIGRLCDAQKMLASEIRTSREENSKVLNSVQHSLQNIERSSSVSEYYNGITARNTSYMAWLETSIYNKSR